MWTVDDSGAVAFLSLKTARSSAAAERMGSRGVRRYVRQNKRSLFAALMKDWQRFLIYLPVEDAHAIQRPAYQHQVSVCKGSVSLLKPGQTNSTF